MIMFIFCFVNNFKLKMYKLRGSIAQAVPAASVKTEKNMYKLVSVIILIFNLNEKL